MTEIPRLLEGGEINEFERWLVQSGANERPGSVLTAQMRSGLGLSAVSVGARVSSISSLKLTLLAVTLGTLMGVHGSESKREYQTPAQLFTTSQLAPEPFRNETEPSGEDIAATDFATNDEKANLASPAPFESMSALRENKSTRTKVRTRLAERGPSGPDLREEIRLLDLARTAIQRQKPVEALASLKTYTNRFSAGSFKQEASVLRMQALAQLGDMSRASSMAKQFVESNPDSPYVGHAARIAKTSVSSDKPQ